MPAFPLAQDFVHDKIDAQNKLTDGSCTGCRTKKRAPTGHEAGIHKESPY